MIDATLTPWDQMRCATDFAAPSGVSLLFEHSPSRTSEIEHFEIFSRPRENQLTRQFFIKFNSLLSFSFPNALSALRICGGI